MAPPALARRAWKFRLSLARAEAETGAKGLVRLLKRLVEVFVGAVYTRVFTRVKVNRGRDSRTKAKTTLAALLKRTRLDLPKLQPERSNLVRFRKAPALITKIPHVLRRTGVHGSIAGVRFCFNIWFV